MARRRPGRPPRSADRRHGFPHGPQPRRPAAPLRRSHALGIACGQAKIGVDVHVHRIANRWGYVGTTTPEQTTVALERPLPERHRVEIDALFVPFGKHVCTGLAPRCSGCPVLAMCPQIGVTSHR